MEEKDRARVTATEWAVDATEGLGAVRESAE
jgi:hypothetical protein